MQTDLLKLLPQFDVISFDVFDTLLLRPYLKPTDLFRKVAGETFMKERIAAERAARDEASCLIWPFARQSLMPSVTVITPTMAAFR